MKEQQILKCFFEHIPGLKNKEILLQKLPGLANLTFAVIVQGEPLYVFKKHIADTKRQTQHKVIVECAKALIGPHCIFYNQQYSILEYVKNARSPTTKQLFSQPLLTKIMQKLYKFHNLKIQLFKQGKREIFSYYLFSDQQYKILLEAGAKECNNPSFSVLYSKVRAVLDKRQYYSSLLLPPVRQQKIKICHQDLFNSNILLSEDEVYFIDYQFTNYNFAAFDIANFINESGIDYTKGQYPGFQVYKTYSTQQIYQIVQYYPGADTQLKGEVLRSMCVVNLYWAIGSLMNADYTVCPTFDIVKSGVSKMDLFQHYFKIIHHLQKAEQ